MSLRIIEISAPSDASNKIKELSERYDAIDIWQALRKTGWLDKTEDKRITTRILVDIQNQQDMLDALQRAVINNEGWRITLIPVEATLPRPEDPEKKASGKLKIRDICLLYTSRSPRDLSTSRMPSSA